ncbi:class I SAM-dependent methyltransferase [Pseudonocardia xinjiangensis]|uniref:Class I SAM-dependent methyltransferase n=1 Tax=Pseudonocardia xinjiangensis TaxID=75289 RepID=A0ABX1RM98_9PSEU|nr:class I SAM-dependent methyltransferase [Pseudonocardia xinjiangensis]NMH81493.1 class I SAM-dependent methyltransferase [Pseudonocardia xinjiangensis]
MDAATVWAERQEGRGIPPEILAKAPNNPFHHDVDYFAAPSQPVDTPSRRAALELLADGGTVLDVGCGGGAAAFALVGRITHATGVDQQQDMLDSFAAAARARDLPYRTVAGRWPDVAAEAGTADVVVSHHVLHNVVDLPPFVRALTAAARRGVVVEMMTQHPTAWLDPLWERFHGLHRPPSATTDDAVGVLRELGIEPAVQRWERASDRRDPVWVARRLCLPEDRVPEVDAVLDDLDRVRTAATLTWTVG